MFTHRDNITPSLQVGAKALRLKELFDLGFNVPEFAVISGDNLPSFAENNTSESLRDELAKVLPATSYAVRSAAINEDGQTQSQAGRYRTKLQVAPNAVYSAIEELIHDAQLKQTPLPDFSIIVQIYIDPEFAGVLFTRNPLGSPEMVVEYTRGTGENVVGGKQAKRLEFINKPTARQVTDLPPISELTSCAHSIETHYDWPQDIEWAYRDGKLHLLQTRPITSITEPKWHSLQFLEKCISTESNYHYERTSLAETFDQPRPLAFSILQALHANNGPIRKAYQTLGLQYADTGLVRQFGNYVYVDRVAETASVFPALRYKKHHYSFSLSSWRESKITLLNLWKVWRLRAKDQNYQTLRDAVQQLNTLSLDASDSVRSSWQLFSTNYPTIYLINFFSQKSLHQLSNALRKDSALMPLILATELDASLQFVTPNNPCEVPIDRDSIQGNSISIDDQSLLTVASATTLPAHEQDQLNRWWQSTSTITQRGLAPYIRQAQQFNRLREQARLAGSRLMHHLRTRVEQIATKEFPEEPDLIYYTTLAELQSNILEHSVCRKRKAEYEQHKGLVLPVRITDSPSLLAPPTNQAIGLSPGQAQGKLVTLDQLKQTSGQKILYTQTLSPDLASIMSQIDGIITVEGGLLSHLAIVAREMCIPIVCTQARLKLDTIVSIDGTTGEALPTLDKTTD